MNRECVLDGSATGRRRAPFHLWRAQVDGIRIRRGLTDDRRESDLQLPRVSREEDHRRGRRGVVLAKDKVGPVPLLPHRDQLRVPRRRGRRGDGVSCFPVSPNGERRAACNRTSRLDPVAQRTGSL
jgi:hypothetical protein